MSPGKLSSRGTRIVSAVNEFATNLAAGIPIGTKYTVRQVRVIPKPSLYPPARVRAVRELIWGKPRGFRPVVGSESDDDPILGTRFTSAVPDRPALSRRDRNGAEPFPRTYPHRRG